MPVYLPCLFYNSNILWQCRFVAIMLYAILCMLSISASLHTCYANIFPIWGDFSFTWLYSSLSKGFLVWYSAIYSLCVWSHVQKIIFHDSVKDLYVKDLSVKDFFLEVLMFELLCLFFKLYLGRYTSQSIR